MNNRLKLWTLLIVPMLGGTAVNAAPAQDQAKLQNQTEPAPLQNKARQQGYSPTLVGAGLSAAEARQLAEQYQLVGVKSLPPGVRKKLAQGKPLPPGLEKRAAPAEFLARLPIHSGYEWQLLGTDLVLVSVATLVVADVLKDVFR